MHIIAFTAAGIAALGIAVGVSRTAWAEPAPVISGPHVHENLAVYFVHGPSAPGPVPLTLQEALAKGSVRVIETGEVNELKVENTGDEDIFIQSGDIVKGGKQDRVLTMSFVLPPKSGEVGLAAFCVEHGRWSARGGEDVKAFASAAEAMPSREAKLAMRAPRGVAAATTAAVGDSGSSETYERQQKVWASVATTQEKLSGNLDTLMAAPASATSLQLSLENEKLQKARAAYTAALQSARRGQGRHRRLHLRHQRPHRQRRRLSLARAVRENVEQAARRRRDRGHRRSGGRAGPAAGAGSGRCVPQGRRGHRRPRRSR